MDLTDLLQLAAATLASIGVGGAIVLAFSSWLGKVWAARILEEDRARLQRMVQRTEHDAQRALEMLKSNLSSRAFVHRVQFETEVEAYRAIWQALVPAVVGTLQLRPVLDYSEGLSEEQLREKKLKQSVDTYNSLSEQTKKYQPFLPQTVADEIDELYRLLRKERLYFQHRTVDDVGVETYWEDQQRNAERIQDQGDLVCEAIRERLGLIEVLGSAAEAPNPVPAADAHSPEADS